MSEEADIIQVEGRWPDLPVGVAGHETARSRAPLDAHLLGLRAAPEAKAQQAPASSQQVCGRGPEV